MTQHNNLPALSRPDLPSAPLGKPTTNFAPPATTVGAEIAKTRTQQETHLQFYLAKAYPRDEDLVLAKILKACARPAIAETAIYCVERGKDKQGNPTYAKGPSIALAKLIAQMYGNFQFGTRQLSAADAPASEIEAYAWDLETNDRPTYEFTVEHIRYSRKHGKTKLDDPQQIYEVVNARASRYLRKAIFDAIPAWLVEEAKSACVATMRKAAQQGNIQETLSKLFATFEAEFGINEASIVAQRNKARDQFTPDDVVELRGIYRALKDGDASADDFGFVVVTEVEAKPVVEAEPPAETIVVNATPAEPVKQAAKPAAPPKLVAADIPDDMFNV